MGEEIGTGGEDSRTIASIIMLFPADEKNELFFLLTVHY